jgi:hypothetical protein
MVVTLATGQTLRVSFVHSSPDAHKPKDDDAPVVESASGLRQRIDNTAQDIQRRLTFCELAEVAFSGDSTGHNDEKSYLVLGEGWAVCHEKDQFRKEVGRKIALTGALTAAGLDREAREQVWAAYLDSFKN